MARLKFALRGVLLFALLHAPQSQAVNWETIHNILPYAKGVAYGGMMLAPFVCSWLLLMRSMGSGKDEAYSQAGMRFETETRLIEIRVADEDYFKSQGVVAADLPGLSEEQWQDEWGNRITREVSPDGWVVLRSPGPDGKPDSKDDYVLSYYLGK